MAHLPIPPPRRIVHPLRDVASATTTIQALPNNRRRATIDHEPLQGVTPAMLRWWFENIGGSVEHDGQVIDRYLAWHPVDHIHWELARPSRAGGAQEGARFRIVEAFGARPEFYVDTTERVERLDETGIRLVRRFAGVKVFELSHTWSRCVGHTHYVSVMEIGAVSRAFAAVNLYLTRRRFPADMTEAWVRHNVEEVGLLEHVLPRAARDVGAAAQATADSRRKSTSRTMAS